MTRHRYARTWHDHTHQTPPSGRHVNREPEEDESLGVDMVRLLAVTAGVVAAGGVLLMLGWGLHWLLTHQRHAVIAALQIAAVVGCGWAIYRGFSLRRFRFERRGQVSRQRREQMRREMRGEGQ